MRGLAAAVVQGVGVLLGAVVLERVVASASPRPRVAAQYPEFFPGLDVLQRAAAAAGPGPYELDKSRAALLPVASLAAAPGELGLEERPAPAVRVHAVSGMDGGTGERTAVHGKLARRSSGVGPLERAMRRAVLR